jgi:acetyl-CoA synthetase
MEADDRVAIDLPMTVESVAIYLGALMAGGQVVTVADSFAATEIAVRLGLGQARCIFRQDFAIHLGKRLPL